jgi:hypothetical protein
MMIVDHRDRFCTLSPSIVVPIADLADRYTILARRLNLKLFDRDRDGSLRSAHVGVELIEHNADLEQDLKKGDPKAAH